MSYIDEQTNTGVADSIPGTTDITSDVVEQPGEQAQSTEQTSGVQSASENQPFDPNSIPEELKPAYKQMQADYTKKMQALAEERRQAEVWKQQAQEYQKYSQYIPKVEEMLSSQQQQATSPELIALEQQYRAAGYSDEAIDMMKMGIGFALNHVNQTQTQQREIERVTSGIQQAAQVDPRLNDTSLVYQAGDEQITFGQMVEQLVEADPKWKADPVAATKRAITRIDAMIGKAKTDGKEELSAQAKAKAQRFPASTTSPQQTSEAEMKGSIRDIGKQVMTEMGIKS